MGAHRPPISDTSRVSLEPGTPLPGWGLDHVAMLVPDLDAAVERLSSLGVEPRLRLVIKDRPTAFFRVGPVLEVIESPVRAPAL